MRTQTPTIVLMIVSGVVAALTAGRIVEADAIVMGIADAVAVDICRVDDDDSGKEMDGLGTMTERRVDTDMAGSHDERERHMDDGCVVVRPGNESWCPAGTMGEMKSAIVEKECVQSKGKGNGKWMWRCRGDGGG